MSSSATLVRLSRLRWNTPVLAYLGTRDAASGFNEIQAATRAPRDSLRRSLEALGKQEDWGPPWIRRQDRGGAYRLTRPGVPIARGCHRLEQQIDRLAHHLDAPAAKLRRDAYRSWFWPLVHALRGGALRFSEIQALLAPITPRSLTLLLRTLGERGWLDRSMEPGYPPVIVYALTTNSQRLLPPLRELAGR